MGFIYGVLTTIAIIAFFAWGSASLLGNKLNPGSWVVGQLLVLMLSIKRLFRKK